MDDNGTGGDSGAGFQRMLTENTTREAFSGMPTPTVARTIGTGRRPKRFSPVSWRIFFIRQTADAGTPNRNTYQSAEITHGRTRHRNGI